jgi:aconitate decarboxylase
VTIEARGTVPVDRDGRAAMARLGTFVAGLEFENLPESVVAHAKLDILDSLGCAIFGQSLPLAPILQAAAQDLSHTGSCVVWGAGWSTTPDMAALVNGTLTHSFELDDLHAVAIVHPGGVTLPSALALAQGRALSGRDLVVAYVAGLEVCTRVGLAVGVPLLRRGWHNNGVLGVFGASAAGASILRLSPAQTGHALGTAGSLAAGLMAAQYGAMVKRLHAGQAAQSGLRAAVLAEKGLTGIEQLFGESYGEFFPTFADSWDASQVDADLGSRWETLNVGFKPYAACGSSHTTIDVLLRMREQASLRPEEVRRILVRSSTATKEHVGWHYEPNSSTTAQMNLSYAAAVVLIDGAASTAQFSDDRLNDPQIVDLAHRVDVRADPEIDARGRTHRHEVMVDVELVDGRVLTGSEVHALGSPYNPIDQGRVVEKFETIATHTISGSRARQIADHVLKLDSASTTDRLYELLRWP